MTLDSEPPTPEPPNTVQVIVRNDETETTENLWMTTTKPRFTIFIPTPT